MVGEEIIVSLLQQSFLQFLKIEFMLSIPISNSIIISWIILDIFILFTSYMTTMLTTVERKLNDETHVPDFIYFLPRTYLKYKMYLLKNIFLCNTFWNIFYSYYQRHAKLPSEEMIVVISWRLIWMITSVWLQCKLRFYQHHYLILNKSWAK